MSPENTKKKLHLKVVFPTFTFWLFNTTVFSKVSVADGVATAAVAVVDSPVVDGKVPVVGVPSVVPEVPEPEVPVPSVVVSVVPVVPVVPSVVPSVWPFVRVMTPRERINMTLKTMSKPWSHHSHKRPN